MLVSAVRRIVKFCLLLKREREREKERERERKREKERESLRTMRAWLVKLAPSFDDSHPAPCYFLTLLQHCPALPRLHRLQSFVCTIEG